MRLSHSQTGSRSPVRCGLIWGFLAVEIMWILPTGVGAAVGMWKGFEGGSGGGLVGGVWR